MQHSQLFLAGLCFGLPTVMVPQLRKDNLYYLDDELSSWICKCNLYPSIVIIKAWLPFSSYTSSCDDGNPLPPQNFSYNGIRQRNLIIFHARQYAVQCVNVFVNLMVVGFTLALRRSAVPTVPQLNSTHHASRIWRKMGSVVS